MLSTIFKIVSAVVSILIIIVLIYLAVNTNRLSIPVSPSPQVSETEARTLNDLMEEMREIDSTIAHLKEQKATIDLEIDDKLVKRSELTDKINQTISDIQNELSANP